MRELSPSPSRLVWRSDTASGVRLVTVRDVKFRSAWRGEGDAVVVAAHRTGHGGALFHLTVGPDGVEEVLAKDVSGADAALMTGPDGAPWVRMSVLEDGVDQAPDTVLPLRGRSDGERPPRTSPFAGDFVGWIGDRAFWHLDDVFDEHKPSRIQAADLGYGVKGPRLQFRRPVRLPLPQSHDAVVCADGTRLAVLALDADPAGPATLRILAPETLVIERELLVARDPGEAFLTLAEACRDGTALLYSVARDGRVTMIRLDSTGAQSAAPAGALPGEPFSVWQVRGPARHALRFTTEHANGLLTLRGATPTALWTGTPHRYHDTIGGREVPLPADWGRPLLSDVVTNSRGHVLVLTSENDPHRLALLFD
ncbi:hypothetical protein [Streptomyces sp. NPDC088350]|uniref:hypothetical protein n=1 Tax=Streptomyces sp. NPDC088350 TaxID=3365854 RepID=UPI003821F7C6